MAYFFERRLMVIAIAAATKIASTTAPTIHQIVVLVSLVIALTVKLADRLSTLNVYVPAVASVVVNVTF